MSIDLEGRVKLAQTISKFCAEMPGQYEGSNLETLAKTVIELDKTRSEVAKLKARWDAVGEVLAEEGCDCEEGCPDDERCLGHRIEEAYNSVGATP